MIWKFPWRTSSTAHSDPSGYNSSRPSGRPYNLGAKLHGTSGVETQCQKKPQIRNSTVDFLVFTKDAHEEGIEVRAQDNTVWLTQKAIGQLFDVDRSVVTKHLKKIFKSGEFDENPVCAFFAHTADDGKTYRYKFYALPAIIAVGYRTNSQRAAQFRQ